MNSLFDLNPRRYRNSFRARVVLAVADGESPEDVGTRFGLPTEKVKRWVRAYSTYSREQLVRVEKGEFDSPNAFLITLEENAPHNHLLHHAAQCRIAGIPPEEFCEEYPIFDPDQFMDIYERVKDIPLDDLAELQNSRIVRTQVNYDNIIKNLERAINALHKGAQAEHPSPIIERELRRLEVLSDDLNWAIGRFSRCFSKSTQKTEQ